MRNKVPEKFSQKQRSALKNLASTISEFRKLSKQTDIDICTQGGVVFIFSTAKKEDVPTLDGFNPRLFNCGEIARLLNVTQSYVHMLFSGQRKSPERMEQIRELLSNNISTLVKSNQHHKKPQISTQPELPFENVTVPSEMSSIRGRR